MEYLATKYQRKKDPFADNPLPKPFYYPSPTKDVDEQEAIRSPGYNRKKPLDGKSVENNVQLTTSALPHVQTLDNHGHDLISIADSYLDETWPNSDKTSSFSLINEGDTTTVAGSPNVSNRQNTISDIVKNLENIGTRHRAAKGDVHKETSDSVLKRYIERFRNSDPRPREERIKENEKTKQDFWWLDSSPASNGSKTDADDGDGGKVTRKGDKKRLTESQAENRLTREALLAMDEETMKLQLKADRLLSQSKSSLSSGPIVSTEGVGSSIAGSELSFSDVQPPYRPSFLKDVRSENPLSVPVPREGIYLHSNKYQVSSLHTDDILLRWRLSRKLDSSYLHPSHPGAGGSVGLTASKCLDPRLEEFRKKLLSQKALVTKEEINFERQRMALLLDEEEFIEKMPPNSTKEKGQFISDPILERMRKITSSADFLKPSTVATCPVISHTAVQQHQSQDVNSSNAGTKLNYELPTENLHPVTADNTNNTASSGTSDINGEISLLGNTVEVSVDHFRSQVVCDPKEQKYELHPGTLVSGGGDAVKMVTSVENANTMSQGANSSNNVQVSVGRVRDSGDSVGTEVNGRATDHPLVNLSSDIKTPKKQKVDYHQYLEAEKDEGAEMKDRIDKVREEQESNIGLVKISAHMDKCQTEKSRDEYSERFISGSKSEMHNFKRKPKLKEKIMEQVISSGSSDISDKSSCRSNRSIANSDISEKPTHRSDGSDRSLHKRNISKPSTEHHKAVDEKTSSKSGHINNSEMTYSPQKIAETFSSSLKPVHSAGLSPSLHFKNPVQAAIGQTVREQMFEGPSLISSVDSWASIFPQSPGPVQSVCDCDSHLASPLPSGKEQTSSNHEPLQSTPISQPYLSDSNEPDGYQSDGEFSEDPLLLMLREQRNNFLKLLEQIEIKLQET